MKNTGLCSPVLYYMGITEGDEPLSYFAPYIDASGVHMPTYEDRLDDLVTAYRNIFGIESELSAAVPDYQLLSVFARALDDTSALVVQDFNSRNPMYASGTALDLLLPQYGQTRNAGETDAEVRSRIRSALAGRGTNSYDALLAAIRNADAVEDAKLYVNDTDETDADGIPAHSIAAVVMSGYTGAVARAIFDHKPPGIGTYGSTSKVVTDGDGNGHTVYFTRYDDLMIQLTPFITVLAGGNRETIENAVKPAIIDFVNALRIGETLNVPQLYGIAYAADPSVANTFVITDIQAAVPGQSSVIRGVVPCAWNEKISLYEANFSIHWN